MNVRYPVLSSNKNLGLVHGTNFQFYFQRARLSKGKTLILTYPFGAPIHKGVNVSNAILIDVKKFPNNPSSAT